MILRLTRGYPRGTKLKHRQRSLTKDARKAADDTTPPDIDASGSCTDMIPPHDYDDVTDAEWAEYERGNRSQSGTE